jgi:hypothetical protein
MTVSGVITAKVVFPFFPLELAPTSTAAALEELSMIRKKTWPFHCYIRTFWPGFSRFFP